MENSSSVLSRPRLLISAQIIAALAFIHQTQIEKQLIWPAIPFLAFIAYALFIKREFLEKSLFWLALSILYTFNLVVDFYEPSNHHFVFFYLFISLALTFKSPVTDRESIFQSNAKSLLVAILFFAAFQKAISPEFMDGSFFAYLISTGSFFKPFYFFADQAKSICHENVSLLINFIYQDPNLGQVLQIKKPIPSLSEASFIFSYKVLIIEALLPVAWLVMRSEQIKHLILIAFVIGTFICVPETGFLSMILTLGFCQCPEDQKKIRALYLFIICLFISFILLGIGRP